jgi:DNA-binding NarL/FixJ family response regulator
MEEAARIGVLLADDDRRFAEALHALVDEQPDLRVVGAATDGLEALELVDQLEPDAVVLDLHMPRLDGVSAAARLRRDHPDLCLIALTADEEPALHRAANEAGVDAVLVKEQFFGVLVERLADALVLSRRHVAQGERAATNESVFRAVNEVMARERGDRRGETDFVCECGDASCAEMIQLTLEEYETARAHPARFLLRPGHERSEAERVVDRNDRFVLTEKTGAARAIAAES